MGARVVCGGSPGTEALIGTDLGARLVAHRVDRRIDVEVISPLRWPSASEGYADRVVRHEGDLHALGVPAGRRRHRRFLGQRMLAQTEGAYYSGGSACHATPQECGSTGDAAGHLRMIVRALDVHSESSIVPFDMVIPHLEILLALVNYL